MKILVSKTVNLDLFYKNPIKILEESDNGAIAVFKNNTLIFYAITPYVLKKLFDIEYESGYKKIQKEIAIKKFPMHSKWMPDQDFIHQSAVWGVTLKEQVKKHELASFISYWESEGCFFHHIQWQQKLARSLQNSRNLDSKKQKKRDITYIPMPDQEIPDGFRGK